MSRQSLDLRIGQFSRIRFLIWRRTIWWLWPPVAVQDRGDAGGEGGPRPSQFGFELDDESRREPVVGLRTRSTTHRTTSTKILPQTEFFSRQQQKIYTKQIYKGASKFWTDKTVNLCMNRKQVNWSRKFVTLSGGTVVVGEFAKVPRSKDDRAAENSPLMSLPRRMSWWGQRIKESERNSEERQANDNEAEEGSDDQPPGRSASHFNSVWLPKDVNKVQRRHGRLRGRRGRCQPRAIRQQLPSDTAQHQGEINVSGTLTFREVKTKCKIEW